MNVENWGGVSSSSTATPTHYWAVGAGIANSCGAWPQRERRFVKSGAPLRRSRAIDAADNYGCPAQTSVAACCPSMAVVMAPQSVTSGCMNTDHICWENRRRRKPLRSKQRSFRRGQRRRGMLRLRCGAGGASPRGLPITASVRRSSCRPRTATSWPAPTWETWEGRRTANSRRPDHSQWPSRPFDFHRHPRPARTRLPRARR